MAHQKLITKKEKKVIEKLAVAMAFKKVAEKLFEPNNGELAADFLTEMLEGSAKEFALLTSLQNETDEVFKVLKEFIESSFKIEKSA